MTLTQAVAFYKPHPGGQETYVQGLARALAAETGSGVSVLTCNTEGAPPEEQDGAVLVRRFPVTSAYYKALNAPELRRALRRARADPGVLHLHAPFPLGLEAVALGSRRAGLVVTFHGEGMLHSNPAYRVPRAAYAWWEKRLFHRVDRVVFLSSSYRDSLRLPRKILERCTVVPPATDTARFTPGDRPRDGSLREALFVGNLSEHNRYKGVDVLLRALALVDGKLRPRLTVVGRGALVPEYRALAGRLGVEARFLEEVTDEELPHRYREADLLVLPSIHGPENAPMVVLESMASGTPVLASRLPGVDELVEEGETGLLATPGDVEGLAEALEALALDPRLLRRLGEKARERTRERHSWPAVARRYLSLYEEILGGRAP